MNYGQLLPNASTYEAYAPLSYQSFGQTPQVSAATVDPARLASTPGMQAATVDNSQLPGALAQYSQLNAQALAPQFRQQQDALDGSEASRGIFNSTAGQQLQNDLSGQQAGALAAANSPLVQQFAGAYNSNQQFNAGNQQAANAANYQGLLGQNDLQAQLEQQAGLSNQGAYNNANQYNADAYGVVNGANLSNYNTYLNSLMGQNIGQANGLVQGTLGSYDPQANGASSLFANGAANAGSAYNTAYANGANNTANLSSAFGTLGSQLGNSIGRTSHGPVNQDFSGSQYSGISQNVFGGG